MTTEPSVMALRISCHTCGKEYNLEPARVIGNQAWYSSDKDNCKFCGSMNIEATSFLHPEDVKVIDMNNVYPSVHEFVPDLMLSMIPASLYETIKERYETLGPKYVTETQHTDGRLINACMFTDDVQNILEEVVDAVFRSLIKIYKSSMYDSVMDNNDYTVLRGLIEIYQLLMSMKELNAVA